ncbi:MAG TPA: class II aldolase/adducin family protein, partial [Verrucomicrobiae bacterium]|nr:class II aldolase/adducin family protein [Verrucomicrobiae bacterium]
LGALTDQDLTSCDTTAILALLETENITDMQTEAALMGARLHPDSKRPSTETVFHAWLLSLENIRFVGHCHPTAANQVLCSPRARDFAERRIFPDEIVCCGPASVFVPYMDPGLPLAREVREQTNLFIKHHQLVPRLILLQNHGIIALGPTPQSVLACIFMATKAAEIFVGAAALGGPTFMQQKDVDRIHLRPDEVYRQQQLRIG